MRVKVCGLKDPENIAQVLECNPDYLGFIFYENSPRFVAGLNADLIKKISSVKKAGVFVNETQDEILKHVSAFGLDLVQLHGNESVGFCTDLQKQVSVIKAFQFDDDFDFSILNDYKDSCDYFLFDSKSTQYGGSGKKFNWQRLKEYKWDKPFFLSGGITLDDLTEISNLRSQIPALFAIDVNSGFEDSPGIKNINKLNLLKQQR